MPPGLLLGDFRTWVVLVVVNMAAGTKKQLDGTESVSQGLGPGTRAYALALDP